MPRGFVAVFEKKYSSHCFLKRGRTAARNDARRVAPTCANNGILSEASRA